MVDKLSKYISYLLYALMAVSVVLSVMFYSNNLDTSVIINWAYFLVFFSVIVAFISPVYGFILSPQNTVKMLIMLGAVAVIAIISYSITGNTFSETKLQVLNTSANVSHLVGMGLLFTYISFAIAILVIIFSSLSKIFK